MATIAQPLSAQALKVKTQIEAAKVKPAKGSPVKTIVSDDGTICDIAFDMGEYIDNMSPSDSGKTEGCTLAVNGEFTKTIPGVGPVTYRVKGNAWLSAVVVVPQEHN